jgi:hypothetical protein
MAGSGATSVSLFYKGCDIILTLRVLGGACGAAILTLGILCFFFCDEVRYYFTATYQVIFGILIILGEVGIDSLLSNFPFLRYFFGKGLFFIFVALFSIGDGEPYEWVIVSVLILTSIFYLVLGCGCCRTEDKYRGQGRQRLRGLGRPQQERRRRLVVLFCGRDQADTAVVGQPAGHVGLAAHPPQEHWRCGGRRVRGCQ